MSHSLVTVTVINIHNFYFISESSKSFSYVRSYTFQNGQRSSSVCVKVTRERSNNGEESSVEVL